MQMGICKRVVIERFIINTIIEATVIESMSRAVSVGLSELNACCFQRWLSQLLFSFSSNIYLKNKHLDNGIV